MRRWAEGSRKGERGRVKSSGGEDGHDVCGGKKRKKNASHETVVFLTRPRGEEMGCFFVIVVVTVEGRGAS